MGVKGKSASLGYTDLNIDGKVTLHTGVLTGIDLTNDVTLTVDQCTYGILEITKGSSSKVIIIPTAVASQYKGKLFVIANTDESLACGIKVAGGTAVSVASTKTAIVRINTAGTEVLRVTADA